MLCWPILLILVVLVRVSSSQVEGRHKSGIAKRLEGSSSSAILGGSGVCRVRVHLHLGVACSESTTLSVLLVGEGCMNE